MEPEISLPHSLVPQSNSVASQQDVFYGKELFHLAQPPIWLSVVRDFLIGLFAATLNIGDKFPYQESEDAPFRSDRNEKDHKTNTVYLLVIDISFSLQMRFSLPTCAIVYNTISSCG